MTRALEKLFAALIILLALTAHVSGQDVIRASGGTNISIDSLYTGGYTTISGPTIRETASGQLVQGGTVVLTLPAGYEWNTALTATDVSILVEPTGANGTDLLVEFTSVSATEAIFTITQESVTAGKGKGPGRVDIQGLQLRPANTSVPDINTITNTGTTGPDLNYGELSKKAGSIASVNVEDAPDGSGQIVQAQDLLAGNSIAVYSVARDLGGNFIENIALANEADWSLIDVTGNIVQGALTPAVNLRSAQFSSQQTGTAKIEAYYNGVTITPSDLITVLPRSVQQMVLTVQPSATAKAGRPFGTQPVLQLLDQFGNVVTTDNSTQISAGINSGTGTLSGTLNQTANAGQITFTDLSADVANTINLKFESSGLSTVVSNDIVIDHNEAKDLLYLIQPTNTAQNSTISPAVELQLIDDFGNYVDSVVAVTISGEAYFKNSSTLGADTDSDGKATFSNLNILNNATVGAVSFDADFTGINAPVSSNNFEIISSGDLAKFVIEATGGTDITDQEAGQTFDIRIRALDGSDNVFTAFEDTVRITADSDIYESGSPVSGITSGAFVLGEFETSITLTKSGLTRIYAENISVSRTGQSNEFTILPTVYDVSASGITASPTQIVADGSSTSTLNVRLKDEYGNNIISGGETVVLSTDAGTFPGSTTTVTSTDQGNGTYSAVLTSSTDANDLATVTGTVNSVALADDATVDFVPGGVETFLITLPKTGAEPDTQIAGAPFPIDIEALDASGNRVEGFNGNITITSNSNISAGSSATLSNGILESHSISLTKSGSAVNLTVSADDLYEISGMSEDFTVIANEPSAINSQVVANPKVLQNDPVFESEITIILRDAYQNRILTEEVVSISTEQLTVNGTASSGLPDATLSALTWNGSQSNYTATLTPSTTVELVEITGFFGSPATQIATTDSVDIVVPNTWTAGSGGPTRTDWTNTGNWTSGVPDSDDYVIIPAVGDLPVLDLNITVGSFEIESGVSLILYGGNAINVTGSMKVDGTLDIEDNTDISVGGGFSGTGTFSAGAQTTIEVGGNISVGGFLARTDQTMVTMNGSSPQTISTQNFLAQNLIVQNDVTVSSGTDLIDANAITIEAGNTLELANGAGITIDVTESINGDGNFILNDNTFVLRGDADLGNVDASNGTVIFGIRLDEDFIDYPDIQQQQIASLSEMQNAIINNTQGVRTFEDVIVTGDLTLENGPLIISSGKSLIAPNIIYNNGLLRMRRGINATKGWRMISSPISSTYADLLDKTVTQGYPNSTLGNAAVDSLQPNVMWYDETHEGTDNQRWRAPIDAVDNLTPGLGLFVYFFGDVAGDSRYNTVLPLTLDIEGQENNGDGTEFTFPVTFTAAADSGWNLIGNPYGASIDWDGSGWTKTNVDDVLYVWDPVKNDYLYWNGIGGGDIDGESLNNGIIKPFQAFWVKANAESPILSITNSSKTTGGTFAGKNQKSPASIGFLIQAGGQSKSMHITWSPNGKTGKDERDAYRLLPFDTDTYLEFFTTLKNGTELAINNLARDFGAEIEIPIHVGGFENGNPLNETYTLTWPEMGDVPESWTLTLVDRESGNEIDLDKETDYTFTLHQSKTKAVSNTPDNFSLINTTPKAKLNSQSRFLLRIHPGEDGAALPDIYELYNNYPNPFNPATTIRFAVPIEGDIELSIFDILGRKVADLANGSYPAGYHQIRWNASSLSSGMYIYRLKTDKGTFSKKMSLIK